VPIGKARAALGRAPRAPGRAVLHLSRYSDKFRRWAGANLFGCCCKPPSSQPSARGPSHLPLAYSPGFRERLCALCDRYATLATKLPNADSLNFATQHVLVTIRSALLQPSRSQGPVTLEPQPIIPAGWGFPLSSNDRGKARAPCSCRRWFLPALSTDRLRGGAKSRVAARTESARRVGERTNAHSPGQRAGAMSSF